MNSFILTFIKTSALIGAVYFSAALAMQINLGGDVEYWLSLFITAGVLVYSFIETQQKV